MGEWKEKKLGDLLRIKHGYAFAGEHIVPDDNGKVLVTPGNFAIGGGWKPSYKKFYSGEFPEDYILGEGDLVVTMTDLSKEVDTLGYSARIPKDDRRTFLHNQRIGLVTDISDEADPDFLYWVMRSAEYRASIVGTASGSTVSHTSPSRIYEYVFDCPDLPEQRAIASVLSSLDAKIDLLHRQNKTLEGMAEALFREWFVEEAEEGWSQRPLSTIATYLNGVACQKYPAKDPANRLPVLKIKELSTGITDSSDWATSEIDPKYHVVAGDVVFSWSATLMVKLWDGPKAVLNQHLFKVTSYEYPKWFYFMWTKHYVDEFVAIATSHATTFGHIKRGDLDEAMVLIPGVERLKEMTKVMDPLFGKHITNSAQIKSLTALRDTLLPKLMSGEVRVEVITN